MSNQNQRKRQPQGRPTGGQFAEETRPSSGVALPAGEPAGEGDAHGGFRLKGVQTMAGGLAFSGTLTRDGREVGRVQQDGRGGVTRVRWAQGPDSQDARDFADVSARATGEDFEPQEEMFTRLLTVDALNRKRAVVYQLDDDDVWTEGQFRQAAAKYSREQVLDALRAPDMAGRNPRIWDRDAGDFIAVQEVQD